MIAFFGILTIASAALILPGWMIARKNAPQGPAIIFLALPGVLLWAALTMSGVGAQSLANVVEVFYIAIISVIVAYAKLFIMDRLKIKYSGIISMVIVLVATLCLRLFVPLIPE
ncbi:MAG: hypothetical protein KJO69_00835 [Gammaproteobacteria bacterium]|nr:hypothetical protein [Gammaproteobacteria bacterium]